MLGTDSSLNATEIAQQNQSEAIQSALLLLFVAVVQRSHTGFEVSPFGFDTHPRVPLLLDCLQRVACEASFLPHDCELLFKTGTFLLPGFHLGLELCARRLEISHSILESSSELLLSKKVLLDGSNASFLIFNQLRLRDILTLMTRRWR